MPLFYFWNLRKSEPHDTSMSDVKFTVSGAMEEEASRRFIDAWHRT